MLSIVDIKKSQPMVSEVESFLDSVKSSDNYNRNYWIFPEVFYRLSNKENDLEGWIS